MQSWSIIVFFHNEEGNIEKALKRAMDFLSPLPPKSKEIICVDDGSADQTVKKIEPFAKAGEWIKIIRHEKKRGIGQALKTGYKAASMENISAVPGDGQFDLNELRAFRDIPPKTVVSFFRTAYPGYSFFRKALTTASRLINRVLFSFYLRDVNWVKIYKKESLNGLSLRSKSSFVETEIIYFLAKDHKLVSAPSRFLPRGFGASKSVSFRACALVLADIALLSLYRLFGRRAPRS